MAAELTGVPIRAGVVGCVVLLKVNSFMCELLCAGVRAPEGRRSRSSSCGVVSVIGLTSMCLGWKCWALPAVVTGSWLTLAYECSFDNNGLIIYISRYPCTCRGRW